MKKSLKNVVCLLALLAMTAPSFAAITGGAHDFSGESWTTEICNVCHTPHGASTTAVGAPLWDHTETATASFGVYTGAQGDLDATVGQPSGTSKLCLSCHDGTVNVDAFGGGAGTVKVATFSATADLGTDLSDSHPISFTYDAALVTADGSLHPITTSSGIPGSSGTISDDMLFAGNVECSSCHDVHGGVAGTKLLVKTNANSALCLTCHDK